MSSVPNPVAVSFAALLVGSVALWMARSRAMQRTRASSPDDKRPLRVLEVLASRCVLSLRKPPPRRSAAHSEKAKRVNRSVYYPRLRHSLVPAVQMAVMSFLLARPDLRVPGALAMLLVVTLGLRWFQRTTERSDGFLVGRDPSTAVVKSIRLEEALLLREGIGICGQGPGWIISDAAGNEVLLPKRSEHGYYSPKLREILFGVAGRK